MGRFIKNFSIADIAKSSVTSIALPSGPTSTQPADARTGALRYNTTLNSFEFYNGTNFVQVTGAVGGKHTITRDSFTLDGSTTAYGALSFEPSADQNVLVFIEGVFQNDSQYNISGTTITLTSILEADNGKTLTVLHGFDTA
jgi:hypothetical protein